MGQHRQTAEAVHENLRELLDWQFAERNDQAVAQALHSGQGVDAVYGLDDAGLLDGFLAFVDESGIKAHWQTLTIAGVRHLLILMANTSGLSNRQDVGACAGLCAPWASWRILGASSVQLW